MCNNGKDNQPTSSFSSSNVDDLAHRILCIKRALSCIKLLKQTEKSMNDIESRLRVSQQKIRSMDGIPSPTVARDVSYNKTEIDISICNDIHVSVPKTSSITTVMTEYSFDLESDDEDEFLRKYDIDLRKSVIDRTSECRDITEEKTLKGALRSSFSSISSRIQRSSIFMKHDKRLDEDNRNVLSEQWKCTERNLHYEDVRCMYMDMYTR